MLHSHHGQKMTSDQLTGKSNIFSPNASNNERKTGNTSQKPLMNHSRLIFNLFSYPEPWIGKFFNLFLSSNFTLQKSFDILLKLMKIKPN